MTVPVINQGSFPLASSTVGDPYSNIAGGNLAQNSQVMIYNPSSALAVRALTIGTSAVGGGSTLTFPARTSGRGPSGIVAYDVTFNGTIDPNISFGYNLAADGTASQVGEPIAHLAFEGNYDDSSGANKIEIYFQFTGLPGQGASTYRPFFSQANRSTGSYRNVISGDLTQFSRNDQGLSVMNVYPTYVDIGVDKANFIEFNGAATLSSPAITALGSDSNVSLTLSSKGTGSILFYTGQQSRVGLIVQNNASSVNYTTLLPGAAGVPAQISADGSDSNIDICLTPKGTGITRFNNATIALGGGSAPTLGTIGGSGPTTAAQNSWFKFKDSSGASFWVPVWK